MDKLYKNNIIKLCKLNKNRKQGQMKKYVFVGMNIDENYSHIAKDVDYNRALLESFGIKKL